MQKSKTCPWGTCVTVTITLLPTCCVLNPDNNPDGGGGGAGSWGRQDCLTKWLLGRKNFSSILLSSLGGPILNWQKTDWLEKTNLIL